MTDNSPERARLRIEAHLAVAIRGPLLPGIYRLNEAEIIVSYPSSAQLLGKEWELPRGLCTTLVVAWAEKDGRPRKEVIAFYHDSATRPALGRALTYINQLFMAYKLARLNHIDTRHIRTVGEADVLYFYVLADGEQVGTSSSSMALIGFPQAAPQTFEAIQVKDGKAETVIYEDMSQFDPYSTTFLAVQHFAGKTHPEGRRLVRCFELEEHGYYAEALIIAFAVLDDLVQEMLRRLLRTRGLTAVQEQNLLLRGIKENRINSFLGPLLKLVHGKSLAELWPESSKALTWLNKTRNEVAHGGVTVTKREAILSVYVVLHCLRVLNTDNAISVDIPDEVYKYGAILAKRVPNVPAWVPKDK